MIFCKKNSALIFSLLFIGLLAVGVFFAKKAGIRIIYNNSPSMPKGFYLVIPQIKYQYNEMVIFTPPAIAKIFLQQHHFIPQSGFLLKYVKGTSGDSTCITQNNLWVNHKKMGLVYNYFAPGKLIPKVTFCGRLKPNQYLLLSNNHPRSYDSRYFGPVNDKNILGKATLIYEQN